MKECEAGAGMPSFKCADIGMQCNFEAKALTRGGLMKKVEAHAGSVHNMASIDADLKAKIEAAIK